MEKKYISWNELIDDALSKFGHQQDWAIYGVPKGGMIAAGFIANQIDGAYIVSNPGAADVILDDILDSGRTKEIYQKKYPDIPFLTVYDRSDFNGEWLVFPWEADHPAGEESVQDNIVRILEYIGETPDREGLQDTPKRVVKSWKELYGGYGKKPEEVFTAFESNGYDEIVLLKDIEMYSTCEHHMLPFFGKAHVAYIPDGKIIGISKLARLVDIYARRLQIQERIGDQVTKALNELLNPKGAACIIEARHMCMCARGVGKQNSTMSTSSMTGAFMEKGEARQELLSLIK